MYPTLLAGDPKSEIEKFGVATGSSAETDTRGRALHKSGSCCKRAAKLKRKKISYQMHWNDCEKSLEESKAKEISAADARAATRARCR